MEGGRVSILEVLMSGVQSRLLKMSETVVVRSSQVSNAAGIVTVVLDPPLLVSELPTPTIIDAAGRAISSSATETKRADGKTTTVVYSLVEITSTPIVRSTVSLVGLTVGSTLGKTDPIIKPAAGVNVRIRIAGTS